MFDAHKRPMCILEKIDMRVTKNIYIYVKDLHIRVHYICLRCDVHEFHFLRKRERVRERQRKTKTERVRERP